MPSHARVKVCEHTTYKSAVLYCTVDFGSFSSRRCLYQAKDIFPRSIFNILCARLVHCVYRVRKDGWGEERACLTKFEA
jgi:hypothetical protein